MLYMAIQTTLVCAVNVTLSTCVLKPDAVAKKNNFIIYNHSIQKLYI